MRHILLIFIDGIGLGPDDPATNPFAVAAMPTLTALTNGQRWLSDVGQQTSDRAILVPTDPRMGVPGKPQSASGQATILTGRVVPELIGEHYGPRPNPPIREMLAADNFFKQVVAHGLSAALLEAYPPQWHTAINSGKRLRSSYQQAAHEAGVIIFEEAHFRSGDALPVDWTGEAWRSQLGYTDTPVLSPFEAGRKMVALSRRYDFAMFPHWITDYIGHRGTLADAVRLLELIDGVMAGALDAWDADEGLLILTSDHGNMEDTSHGKHTENDVPTLIVGAEKAAFADGLTTLADLTPHMGRFLFADQH
ncbi:MAG: hypothetical protein GYB67_18025 [Chloroflexi bacterium]|nr:hypothetical protein [Chloroflexota bacterium]